VRRKPVGLLFLLFAAVGVLAVISHDGGASASNQLVPMTGAADYTGPGVVLVVPSDGTPIPGLDEMKPVTDQERTDIVISPYQAAAIVADQADDARSSPINTQADTFSATMVDFNGVPAYFLVWTGVCGPPVGGHGGVPVEATDDGCGSTRLSSLVDAGGETAGALSFIAMDAKGDAAVDVPASTLSPIAPNAN
jgi:hypothetical protein